MNQGFISFFNAIDEDFTLFKNPYWQFLGLRTWLEELVIWGWCCSFLCLYGPRQGQGQVRHKKIEKGQNPVS